MSQKLSMRYKPIWVIMPSAAERYARFKLHGSIREKVLLDNFISGLEFPVDDFQMQALKSIDSSNSVLVAAPTGAGKTLIAEYGIEKALHDQKRLFYTTPIKALSNQKYRDFSEKFGAHNVGLLTGDRKINPGAPILVMTTEILRNMIYSESEDLSELGWVVMDEVHYLADKFRGAVWEESLILLPVNVGIICLSATVSNAEEFGLWLESIRGKINVIVSEKRPTPLWRMVFHDRKVIDLFSVKKNGEEGILNPILVNAVGKTKRSVPSQNFRRGGLSDQERMSLILDLENKHKLPGIFFIFSRNGCDKAALSLTKSNFTLLSRSERDKALALIKERTYSISQEDLEALDFNQFNELAARGIATHHAGMIPIFKEIVEELFQASLIKVVFATETLALGINMPARSVIVESLRKFDGVKHVDLTPGEFTQLTGRAGRRGIDDEGYSVVPITPGISAQTVASLASARTYPLRSSFRPSYNMSLNLIDKFGPERSLEYLERSFAQFQLDRQVSHLVKKSREIKDQISKTVEDIGSDLYEVKDYLVQFNEYQALVREDRIKRAFNNNLHDLNENKLRPGAVIHFSNKPDDIFVVTDVNMAKGNISVVSINGGYQKFTWDEMSAWPEVYDYIRIPRGFNPRDKIARKRLIMQVRKRPFAAMNKNELERSEILDLQSKLELHNFHRLQDSELKLAKCTKLLRLENDLEKLELKIDSRTSSLARQFRQICDMLENLDYIATDDTLTHKGQNLSNIYAECDLLLAESLNSAVFDNLTNSELAAVLSVFIFESRNSNDDKQYSLPTKNTRLAIMKIERILAHIRDLESSRNLQLTRSIDPGFANAIHDWLLKERLDVILNESDLVPGDFVRWVKQLIDLCNQISNCNISDQLRKQVRDVKKAATYGIVSVSDSLALQVE